uniref:Major sperm protein n=1 Tax=Meloidogyne hapla TaxID=6305 RepID=A0A1I8BRU0_MELHA
MFKSLNAGNSGCFKGQKGKAKEDVREVTKVDKGKAPVKEDKDINREVVQKFDKGKGMAKDDKNVFGDIHVYDQQEDDESNASLFEKFEGYCKHDKNMKKVTFKLKINIKSTEFNSSELFVSKKPMFTDRDGKLKIYHAFWPGRDECVAVKFSILKYPGHEDSAKREIEVLEYFHGLREKEINEEKRVVEYFGQ